ncbi:hypothetical protein Tco_0940675 [Tanacetum coccineum]|uniref:Uncharacterized protein n=1 Tax=Tanacetum coccineum TaxID=301880 RepID=A0ABQ5DP88_9ASTR
MECRVRRLRRNTFISYAVTGLIPIYRGLVQAIPTSLPPQPIREATKASNLLPTSSPHLHLPSADHEADRPERDIGYGITDTWDEMLVDMPGAPTTDDTELGRQITEFAARVTQDTNEIYVRLGDEQTERQLMAGRLNMLYRDRIGDDPWDASDLARSEVMSLRTTVLGQQAVITELQAADRRRQAQFIKALKLLKGL